MDKTMKELTICACSSRSFIDKAQVAKLAACATMAGWKVSIVADLCELAENKSCEMHDIAKTTIAACHSRATKALVEFCGEKPHAILNNRTNTIEELLEQLGIDLCAIKEAEYNIKEHELKYKEEIASMPKKLGEDAWFPVIDKDQCGECGKCLDFCPFGVYEMVDDRIRVVHPHNCKNNCPACARTCPACAVIFPKYDRSPINGGVEKQENAVQIDTRTLYAKAFKERLEERKKIRKGPFLTTT